MDRAITRTDARHRRRAGRPRDAAITQSVLTAVRELLAERGYAATSMQAVAERAGTSVPALYRRWSGKVALVEDALFFAPGRPLPDDDVSFRDGVRTWVRMMLETSAHPAARSGLPGLLAEYGHDAAHLDRIIHGTEVYVRDAFTALVTAGVARGDAHPSCDVEMMFDLLRAATVVRGVLAGDDDIESYSERLTASLVAIAAVPASRSRGDTG